MKLNVALISTALLVSSVAVAQEKDCERKIQQSYEHLAKLPSIRFRMQGTEGGGVISANSTFAEAIFSIRNEDGRPVYRFESKEYAGGDLAHINPIRRIVADGGNFYIYNVADNTYSVSRYRGRRGLSQLVQMIDDAADDGPLMLLGKLMVQIYGDGFPVFKNWLPGGFPVSDRTSVVYSRGSAPLTTTTIAFTTVPMLGISYVEQAGNAISPRTVRYKLMTESIVLSDSVGGANFTFVPPNGSKEIRD